MLKNICIISIVILILSACELNQSVHKDFITGAYSKGDGIVCNDVKIKINGKVENRNSFVYGEKVSFIFNEIHGLTKIDGKVYPKLSMCVMKNEQDTVLYNANVIGDSQGGTDLSSLQLEGHFICTLPYESNEMYKIYVTMSDEKGDGHFTYELPFSVKENDKKVLQINSSDLTYSDIFLWNETKKQIVIDGTIDTENTLILGLEEIDGLEIVKGKIYPVFSIHITDNKGNKILSEPNLLSEYQNSGIEYNTSKNSLHFEITVSPEEINNPYKLEASLNDLNSDRRIDIEGNLEVQ